MVDEEQDGLEKVLGHSAHVCADGHGIREDELMGERNLPLTVHLWMDVVALWLLLRRSAFS